MGFFSRLFGQENNKNNPPPPHSTDLGTSTGIDTEAANAILAELDIDMALAAHENWKIRLQNSLHGTSSEVFRPEAICRDDVCDLGQWLHGAGQHHLGRFPAFAVLVARHRHFHLQASTLASLIQAGETDKAQHLMQGGYQHASNQLELLLKELKHELLLRQIRQELVRH